MNERVGAAASVLAGGGRMGAALRAVNWARHPLGPVDQWPQSLRTVVRLMLDSRYAMWLGWGPDLSFFCNDAYRPTLGQKQGFLGRGTRQVWAEIWPDVGPRIEHVLATGEATWDEGLLLFLERSGFPEETYHSFSYSPVHDDAGHVSGMLCVVSEDTGRVLGERRLRALGDLSNATLPARTTEDACHRAIDAIASDPPDLPFALIYLLAPDGGSARRAAFTGLPETHPLAPADVALDADGPAAWPLLQAMQLGGEALVIDDLTAQAGLDVHGPLWAEPLRRAVIAPLAKAGQGERPAGFLVVGLSPRLALDAEYRRFLALLAGQVANAIFDARAFEDAARRAEELAALDRAKTVFFSNVSHELRTPLTLMLGPIGELLSEASALQGESRQLLALAQRNGRRLQRLVNSLLDFSRIEAGRVQARYEPVDLALHTADLASVFRSAMEKAGLAFEIDCAPLAEPAWVDREMWEKVVLNLLSNALKFTFEGTVRVTLAQQGREALLCVSDTGTGIPAAEQPRLFDRFYRVEGARGRSQEGSGIGLALVRELIGLHGGEVSVQSSPGCGSRFSVRIPLGRAHLPAAQVADAPLPLPPPALAAAAVAALDEAEAWLPVSEWGDLAAPLPGVPDGGAARADGAERAALLIADDNADMRAYLTRLLGRQHRVVAVGDGDAALAQARTLRPDLVLTDVMMPGLDGFALLRALRADPATATTSVILLSARAGDEARLEGLAAGADDYLVKPFNARELLARVAGTLALARARRVALDRETELRGETERVLESIAEGFVAVDAAWRFVYVNRAAEAIFKKPREHFIGVSLWDAFPEAVGSAFEAPYRRAMRERVPVRVDAAYEPLKGWFEVHVHPISGGGLSFYFRDVLHSRLLEAAQRASLEQQRFLLDLNLATQPLADPDQVTQLVVRRLAGQLDADRCLYAEVEVDEDHFTVLADHTRGVPSIVGRWRLGAFGVDTLLLLRSNVPMVAHDVAQDPRTQASLENYRNGEIGAFICVPLHHGGRLVGGLAVHQRVPRRWRDDEVELVRTVTLRCWEAVERSKALHRLRESEERLRRMADSLPSMVFSARSDGGFAWVNRTMREFTGGADDLLGQRRYAYIHPDDRERMRARWERSLASGEPYELEARMRRADGQWRWVLTRAVALRDPHGRVVEWIGGTIDIDDLRRAQQQLQDADRRKDEFLATLAHELRNPLAPLRNAVHILKVAPGAETADRVHAMMQRQIDHLVRLVDDLLDVSRISGGKVELQRAPVPLSAVLASAVETSRPLIEAGRHTLIQRLPADGDLLLDGDAVRLAQIFANLLNNAAKYTDSGGRIDLVAEREGEAQVRVMVRDNGIGIAREMLPRVFELFVQIDGSRTRGQGGLGIGLSLVKNLVTLHGGSVEVTSAGLGLGSEFVVRLPVLGGTAGAGEGEGQAAAALQAPKRVLVVDDNRDAAESMGVLLEFLGASVKVAHDGPSALGVFAVQKPAVVLLDIGMPGMDGYEVARRLRALPEGNDATLIALTGWGQDEDRARTRAAGFDHHLVKPADIEALRALLEAT